MEGVPRTIALWTEKEKVSTQSAAALALGILSFAFDEPGFGSRSGWSACQIAGIR